MIVDRYGHELKEGDEVVVRARVKAVHHEDSPDVLVEVEWDATGFVPLLNMMRPMALEVTAPRAATRVTGGDD
jgi:hypothetical protein